MSMQKLIVFIAEWEPLIFPTRTFTKEIAYWVSLLVASIVLLVNIVDTSTRVGSDNARYFSQDMVANKEYVIAAFAMLGKHVAYTVDTFVLLQRKVARPEDFATNANHIVFWLIIVIFGCMFSSYTCGENIFPCGNQDSRWPVVWLAALFKLIIDIVLFVYFQIVRKRRLSVAHGQTVSVLVLDIQYLLVCLWFNYNWSKPQAKATYYYDAKVLFIVVFIVGMLGLAFMVVCLILGYHEWKGTSLTGVRNKKRAILVWLMALWWLLAFLFCFCFDGTAGVYKATYQILLFIMLLVMIIIGSVYGVFNILAKRTLEFTGYDVNTSMSRSFAYGAGSAPPPVSQHVPQYSGQAMPQFRTHAEGGY